MKFVNEINPLVNPIMHNDQVNCAGNIFTAKTTMQAKWAIYQDGQLVKDNINSQVDLCAWFIDQPGFDHV